MSPKAIFYSSYLQSLFFGRNLTLIFEYTNMLDVLKEIGKNVWFYYWKFLPKDFREVTLPFCCCSIDAFLFSICNRSLIWKSIFLVVKTVFGFCETYFLPVYLLWGMVTIFSWKNSGIFLTLKKMTYSVRSGILLPLKRCV